MCYNSIILCIMDIIQNDPTYIRLSNIQDTEKSLLESALKYKNTSTEYLYQQAKKNRYQYNANPDGWHEHVLKLKSEINQTALFQDSDGFYTYAGLLSKLQKLQLVQSYQNNVVYPSPKALPWAINHKPQSPYPYQEEAVTKLLERPHSALEIATGGGKTLVAQLLVKRMGLRTLIITPFTAIARSMYEEFSVAFGKKYIGLYGDGKKQYKQQIVIAIAASLVKVKKDSEDFEQLSNRDVVITDESHMIGAPTLSEVLLTLCQKIPYRWSVSATQQRGNGTDTLLAGLISDVVYRKDFRELAGLGFLSPLKFRIFNVNSQAAYTGTNPLIIKQKHFLYNPQVIQLVAQIANMRVQAGESVLVLVDELKQIEKIKYYIDVPYSIASSETDVADMVAKFNSKEIKLLFGTSAIGTGANLRPVTSLILFMEGKSEIRYKQGIGRATRLYPGKHYCEIIDFSVENVYQMQRHLKDRLDIYKEMSDDIEFIDE